MTPRGPGALMPDPPAPFRRSGKRARAVAVCMGALFALTAVRGAALSLSPSQAGESLSSADTGKDEALRRADIVDRHGELLATTVDVYSLYADPRLIWDPAETASRLAGVLDGLDEAALAARLSDRARAFVWVRRHLTPRQQQAVFALGLEGLDFRREQRRIYPSASLAGHLLGYTGVDGNGLGGVEHAADEALTAGTAPLRLTIDAGVQFILESELAAAAEAQGALGGAGIIVHAASGEIRALASWPALNPNRAHDYAAGAPARFNRAVTGVYELGSVFKPLTVAAALDAGAVAPEDRFDTTATITIDGQTITDLHPIEGPADVTTIIAESSNLGTVRIARALGGEAQWDALARFGLLDPPAGDIGGAGAPILPPSRTPLASATASYGHGIAVSPLALVMAYAALANDGVRMPARLILPDDEATGAGATGTRVVSAETAETVVGMLRTAVVSGTGKAADASGYRVAGKTGTAEKAIDGVYDPDRHLQSFAAVFPADRPEYAILIVLDEARAPDGPDGLMGGDTAATTAAPLAGRVIGRAAPLLGVLPRLGDPADQAAMERRQSG